MKTIHALTTGTLLGLAFVLAPGASAQTASPSSAPAAPAAPITAPTPAVTAGYDKVVYVPHLPSIEEVSASAPPGTTIERIEVVNGQIVAFYRDAAGAISSVAYAQLSPAGAPATAPLPTPATPAPALTANNSPAAPAPAVSYPPPPPAPVQPTYYSYPTYVYPTAPVYYDSYAYPYAYPYPYLYPFGGLRVGIDIWGGRGFRRR